jgi:hypothetical protein
MIPQRTFLQKNIEQLNTQHVELHTRRAMPLVVILVFVLMILASFGAEGKCPLLFRQRDPVNSSLVHYQTIKRGQSTARRFSQTAGLFYFAH